ncbi:efflux RND transporter permease subunit [Hydrogenimonas thermophila]|uniref:efflux RND transporter permease subunit n=1 Tax=Hydrogenimonas thermophila TaxID=223786 RepID=UPI002936E136|nr:efflux RND transporter permease subunit [Hydrogenimonas thermophila]WOE69967.1 efflux RND transporter permease subunit [Hydrogenimonas thermophila]WOE72484.1 efflux RND transporter permease subunit [Hydrogenimonas thermophila]
MSKYNTKGRGFFLYILKNKLAILLIIFLLAGVGYRLSYSIPKGVFPNLFFPRIEVSIDNGYTPIQQMLFSVTKPSEEALKTIQDVEKIVSSTSIGSTDISIYFNWNIDPYLAYQLVQARVADIKNRIPSNAKITIRQATPSIYPVAIYAIGSNSISRAKLSEKLYYELKPVFLSIPGIYDIEMKAPEWSEYKLLLDTKKMHGYNLDVQTVIDQLKAQNIIEFLGLIEDYHRQYVLSLYQKSDDASKLLNLDIALPNGHAIKLSDISLLVERTAPIKAFSAATGFKNSVVFNLLRQQNANAIDVVNAFNAKLKELAPKLKKEGIEIRSTYDGTDFIKEAIHSVRDAIILGGIIAVLIVFFFLRKVTLSLVSLLIIPITFLITMIGMKLAGIDFNIFSLGGMAAALGSLIDHMIIVIENIERHFKQGVSKKDAVIEGSKEILPIMTVATLLAILIFLPLLLVSGIVGLFFKQLAFVLVVIYIISQLIAVFLTPIIAFIALPDKKDEKTNIMDAMVLKYKAFLNRSVRYAWISIPIILSGFGLSFYLYKTTPSTFLPKWDEGNIVVDIVLPPGTSLTQSQKEFTAISNIIENIPEVDQWTMRIGTSLGQISTQPNEGDFLVTLKKNRERSSFEIIEDLRKQIEAEVPNLEELGLSQVLEDRLGDIMGADAPIAVMLFSSDPNELMQQGYQLKELLKPLKGVEEVNVLTSYASPSVNIHLKPDAKAIYGIDEKSVATQIRSLYYGKSVASVAQGEKLINIRVLMSRTDRDPIDYLQKELFIYSPLLKKSIPLFKVADISYQNRVAEVTHFNLSPVCILGIRFMGDNMSGIVHSIQQVLAQANLPSNITTDISGFYKEQQKSFKEMTYVIIFAILIIFTGLLLHFSDIRIAFNILIAMLLTLSGIFLALKLTGKPLDITAFMGMLIVLSIVINNNVLIYDFYKMHTDSNENEIKRVINAIGVRVRPILMTMLSNAFAMLPIALAIGSGTEVIQSLAIAIMGGLFFAIFVNLYVMPLFFIFSIKILPIKS